MSAVMAASMTAKDNGKIPFRRSLRYGQGASSPFALKRLAGPLEPRSPKSSLLGAVRYTPGLSSPGGCLEQSCRPRENRS